MSKYLSTYCDRQYREARESHVLHGNDFDTMDFTAEKDSQTNEQTCCRLDYKNDLLLCTKDLFCFFFFHFC